MVVDRFRLSNKEGRKRGPLMKKDRKKKGREVERRVGMFVSRL